MQVRSIIIITLFCFALGIGCSSDDPDEEKTGETISLSDQLQTPGNYLSLPTTGDDAIQGKAEDTNGDGIVNGLDILADDELQIVLTGNLSKTGARPTLRSDHEFAFTFQYDDENREFYLDTSGDSLQILDADGNSYQFILDDGRITGLDGDDDGQPDDITITGDSALAAYYAGHRVIEPGCLLGSWDFAGETKELDITFESDGSLLVVYQQASGVTARAGTYEFNGRHIVLTYNQVGQSTDSVDEAVDNLVADENPFRTESDVICGDDFLGLLLDFQDIDFSSFLLKRFDATTGTFAGTYSFMTKTYTEVDGDFALWKLNKYYLEAAATSDDGAEGTTRFFFESEEYLDEDNNFEVIEPPALTTQESFSLYEFDGSEITVTGCPDDTFTGCSSPDFFPGRLMSDGDFIWGLQLDRLE